MSFKPGDRVRSVRPIGLTIPIAVGSVGTVDYVFNMEGIGPILAVNMDDPFEDDDTWIEAFEAAWEAADETR